MVYPSPLTPIHHSSSYSVETHTSIQEGAPAGVREEQEEPSQAPSTSPTSAEPPTTTSMEPGTPTTSWVCDLRNGCEGFLIKIPSAPQPQPLPPQQDSCPADTNTVMCSEVIEMNSVKSHLLLNSQQPNLELALHLSRLSNQTLNLQMLLPGRLVSIAGAQSHF